MTYLPQIAEQKQIVMDSGAVVGSMMGDISNSLAKSVRRIR